MSERGSAPVAENKMGTMPVGKLVFNMSLPMMVSMLVQALYNIVDSIFVAKLSENALTAVSLAFPLQTLLIAVATGTGVGMNALLSKSLGEHNFKKANKIIAISKGTKKSLEIVFPKISNKIEIINNGYNFDMMDKESIKSVLKSNSNNALLFEMLYCNRLDENKNPEFLIEVCKKLKDKGYNFHLNILGDGELKNAINIKIKK